MERGDGVDERELATCAPVKQVDLAEALAGEVREHRDSLIEPLDFLCRIADSCRGFRWIRV